MLKKICNPLNLGLLSVLLVAVAAVSAAGIYLHAPATLTFKIRDVFPKADTLPGWQIAREDIAATETVRTAVNEMLNFTDAELYSYRRGDARVLIYVAYWKPGAMSHRLISIHTPDICWVAAGWRQLTAGGRDDFRFGTAQAMPRAQVRLMEFQEKKEWVAYWHMVGGKVHDNTVARGFLYDLVEDVSSFGVDLRKEQYFVRISSPSELTDEANREVLKQFLENSRRLGLPI